MLLGACGATLLVAFALPVFAYTGQNLAPQAKSSITSEVDVDARTGRVLENKAEGSNPD